MKPKQLITLIVVIIIIALVLLFASKKTDFFKKEDLNNTQTPIQITLPEENVVYITDKGFKPNLLVIKEGETVTWYNNDTSPHWPASNNHPTHKVYPGSNIEKCGTAEESSILDACREIQPGQTYEFTFTRRGTWKYHDHLNTGYISSIAVQ
ncbi:MAG: plastocyanin/azurin family copper-binding protein [Nanoarchaeota archaeon]